MPNNKCIYIKYTFDEVGNYISISYVSVVTIPKL